MFKIVKREKRMRRSLPVYINEKGSGDSVEQLIF